jgi:hypothetical protein
MERQPDLLQIARAACPPRGFPRSGKCRQQNRSQDCDNRNHDQELNKRKTFLHVCIPLSLCMGIK